MGAPGSADQPRVKRTDVKGSDALSWLATGSGAPFGHGSMDLDFRFVSVNPTLAAMTGLECSDHAGRAVADVLPWLWPQIEAGVLHLIDSDEGEFTGEFVAERPLDVPAATWLMSFFALKPGDRLAGIAFIALDVSGYRRAEEIGAVIAQTMEEGCLSLDTTGRLMGMNAAAERLLGWSEHELRGRHIRELTRRRGADGVPLPSLGFAAQRAVRERRPVRLQDDVFVRGDGGLLPVVCSATPEPGGGTVVVFHDASGRAGPARAGAEQGAEDEGWAWRIRDALDDNRFELYSQPIMPLTGGAAREELLLRMITRDGEVISAATFLSHAERCGLIAEIDRWVIGQAVRHAALGRIVQVNLSPASTADPEVLELIGAQLRDVGAPAANMTFEVTATVLTDDAAAGETFARGLQRLGCGLTVDNFRTGYGNFTYLERLPVQSLKIDGGLIRELPSNAVNRHLVQAIVSLARSIGATTIAAGVEDRDTMALLRGYGVDYAQGYHISHPAPARRVQDVLAHA